MSRIRVSVIIPTHNRPEKLAETLASLRQQDLAASDYEIIVIDDGSSLPVELPATPRMPACRLARTEGIERSAARNLGAAIATGDILLFVDDDLTVRSDFVSAHLRAHAEWLDCLAVGAVRLPDESLTGPFGRFRQRLEQQGLPQRRGPTSMRNFCTASNMSISSHLFHSLGGFDKAIVSGEDQDFALRHTARGGQIVFLPEAGGLHKDSSLDIQSYCRRAEWGSRSMIAFCKRHPDWPDNIERARVNSSLRFGREPLIESARKIIKSAVLFQPLLASLFFLASVLERLAPRSLALDRTYRLLLGAHLLRGFREGLTGYNRIAVARDQYPKEINSLPGLPAED